MADNELTKMVPMDDLKVEDFPSKKQYKKYLKQKRWLATKAEKRAKEKLKLKAKKANAKVLNIPYGSGLNRKQLKHLPKMHESSCKVTVVVDLSFDHLMIEKDIGKVIKQLSRCYTENRRSNAPMQFHICNLNGPSFEYMKKYSGYENWDVKFHSDTYLQTFPKDKLIYLTSDSDQVINEIDPSFVYIIGGLVDHNAHKELCYKKALGEGINHGQLPLSNFFKMKRRKTLTINQVFEILLKVCEGRSFFEAFQSILPKRYDIKPLDDPKLTPN